MPRRNEPNIRIRQKDLKLIQTVNNRLYSKRSRLKKNQNLTTNEVRELLPTKSIKEFKTRREYNDYIKQSERLLSRNEQWIKNANNVIIPKKDVEQFQKDVETQNKVIRERKEKYGSIVNAEGVTPQQQQNILFKHGQYDEFKELNDDINRFISKKDFERAKQAQALRSADINEYYAYRDELWRQNFINTLKKVYGTDDPRVRELIDLTERISIEQFITSYYMNPKQFDQAFNYEDILTNGIEGLSNRFNELYDFFKELYEHYLTVNKVRSYDVPPPPKKGQNTVPRKEIKKSKISKKPKTR